VTQIKAKFFKDLFDNKYDESENKINLNQMIEKQELPRQIFNKNFKFLENLDANTSSESNFYTPVNKDNNNFANLG